MYNNNHNKVKQDDFSQASKFLSAIWQRDEVRELRCCKPHVVRGFYDNIDTMAHQAMLLSGEYKGVYFTLNPVRNEKHKDYTLNQLGKGSADDNDIERRRLILIDADPQKPTDTNTNSTNEEHDLSLSRVVKIAEYLSEQGFPQGILADSGNGAHLLLSVDLPNNEKSTDLVRRFLLALCQRFTDSKVKVDTSVYNASRICKLYGTLTKKGEHSEERPQRYSAVLKMPDTFQVCPVELLEKIASEYTPATASNTPKSSSSKTSTNKTTEESIVWLKAFLEEHGIAGNEIGQGGFKFRFVLSSCPFCSSEDTASFVGITQHGALVFRCQHNRCSEPKKTWQDFRKHFDPSYEPPEDAEKKTDNTTRLLEIVKEQCELWKTADHKPYATTEQGKNLPINGSVFARWITSINLDLTGKGLSKSKREEIVDTCSALAERGQTYKVYRRVASLSNSRSEIDLGDETYDAVIITTEGWSIGKPTARFIRTDDTDALPRPLAGGSIEQLRPFINLPQSEFPLFVGCLLDGLKNQHKKPEFLITCLHGEQETGKSLIMKIMRMLIDPTNSEPSCLPKNKHDLAINCNGKYFMAFDNVSKLPTWCPEAMCQIATASSYATRRLYSDDEENILKLEGPIALNGIEDFVVVGEMIRRSVSLHTKVIKKGKKKDSGTLFNDFEKVYPQILGVLYDCVVAGLKNLPSIILPPEDASSVVKCSKWIAACFPALGWAYETWQKPYEEQKQNAMQGSLDNNLVATCLLTWFNDKTEWTGSPSELYAFLFAVVPHDKERYFPANPQRLSSILTRSAPALRQQGIEVHQGGRKYVDGIRTRMVSITRITPTEQNTNSVEDNTNLERSKVEIVEIKQSNGKIEDEPALSDEDFLAKLKSYPDYGNQSITRLNLTAEDNDAM